MPYGSSVRSLDRPWRSVQVIATVVRSRVDAAFASLGAADVVLAPTTMPRGNRSALVRDPDGTLVNLFAPVTDEARARNPLR